MRGHPRRFRPKGLRAVIAPFLGALILFLLWQGLLSLIEFFFPATVAAVHGSVEAGQWVEAAFFRREIMIAVPEGGRFQIVHPAGRRIARLGKIGLLKRTGREDMEILSSAAGLVVYTTDGLEEELSPEAVTADPRAAFTAAGKSRVRRLPQGEVGAGQIVARLIDDHEQYLAARVDGTMEAPPIGGTVWVRLDEDLLPMTVAAAVADRDGVWLALRTERFPRAWLSRRREKVYLILSRYTGTVVPRRYLRELDGQAGLLILKRGEPAFTPVEVVGCDRDRAVVRGISEGDIVISR